MKQIYYSRSALRTLRRMPANQARRIIGKCEQYAADPAAQANNVKALKGSNLLRLRVGDWRVIIDDEGAVLAVLNVVARGSAY